MIYSHKWQSNTDITVEESTLVSAFDRIKKFITWVDKDMPNILADSLGNVDTKPHLGTDSINFNGIGEDSKETMVFFKDWKGSIRSCITDRKPYDVVVVASLCMYKHELLGYLKFTSVGNREDLKEGYELYVLYCESKQIKPMPENYILSDIDLPR